MPFGIPKMRKMTPKGLQNGGQNGSKIALFGYLPKASWICYSLHLGHIGRFGGAPASHPKSSRFRKPDCFTLRVVAVEPSLLSPSFTGTCFSSFMRSAGTFFRMAPPPTLHPRALGGPTGFPQGPRGPWGRTALRAVQKLLFGFSCEMFSMSAVIETGPECPRKAPICQPSGRGIRRRGI